MVVHFGDPLIGHGFRFIDYETPRTGRERDYINHVVVCRLEPGGLMNEVEEPRG